MPASNTPNSARPEPGRPGGGRGQARQFRVQIADRQNLLDAGRRALAQAARQTLAAEQVRAAEISIVLVDDHCIHDLNRRYLGHDYATDVLSFLLDEEPEAAARRAPGSQEPHPRGAGASLSGEVIISTETAVRCAGEYGWNPRDELRLYLVHGLLHLCGYDDLTARERKLMRRREAEILGIWNLVPHYSTQTP